VATASGPGRRAASLAADEPAGRPDPVSGRSWPAPRARPGTALVAVLALALLARAATYARVPPRLNPDAFSYLNVARQLRGVAVPRTWDELANLPRHNEAARTPGYPLFLELVFRLDGYRPTPEWFLESMARQRRFEAFHFEFLGRTENLRAVQLAQHALRLAATALAYAVVERYCAAACGTDYGGVPILRGLVVEGGLSYVEASSRLREQLVRLIVQRPGAYLGSAAAAFVRFWYPQEVALHWEAARTRLVAGLPPAFWTGVVLAYVAATAVMAGALSLVSLPRSAWLALAATAASALTIASLVAVPSDDVRSAFPFAPVLVVGGAAVGRSLLERTRSGARRSDDLDVAAEELRPRSPVAAVRALGRPGPPAVDGEALSPGVWSDGRHEMSAVGSDGEQE
jgi:hypothetical protein